MRIMRLALALSSGVIQMWIVRFSPKQYGEPMSATLVFETEDMKKVYKFTGGTA